MAPLIKDSSDVASSTAEIPPSPAGAPSKQAAASAGHSRADALSLEVPVKVHGSRVTDVARGVAPRTEPFEEETGTMIVFPQGGVLRMSTAVAVSQMLVVTNLKTRQDAICRVVKVRTFTNMQGYVEVEFTHQQPGYWGVHFPSEGPAPANSLEAPFSAPIPANGPAQVSHATSAPPSVVAPAPRAAPVLVAPPPVSFVPAIPAAPAPPSKPEHAFISLGTQEKVQPAASATSVTPAERISPVPPAASHTQTESVLPAFAPEPLHTSVASDAILASPIDFPPAPPAAPPSALTMTELRGDQRGIAVVPAADAAEPIAADEQSSSAADAPAISSRAVFGSFSGGIALSGSHPASADASSVHLDSASAASIELAAAPRNHNWMLIAACVGLLFATVGGGVYYFRPHTASFAHSGAADANPPAIPQSLAFQTPNAPVPDLNPRQEAAARNSALHPVTVVTQSSAPAITASANDPVASPAPALAAKSALKLTPDMIEGTLVDHPVAPQRTDADQAVQVPSLGAAPAESSANVGALSGIVAQKVAVPPEPTIRPDGDGPIKVGGNVKEPRLLSSVLPEYPLTAREYGIQGNVVVKTTIDQKGNVVNMQTVSGPMLLRGPALEALRRWKYEPSTLNGQPIAVQMLVTIKFGR
ncbi:MAG: TonB family protein [Candidatus Acidiferrales bacterium]